MGMQNGGRVAGNETASDAGADPGERCEAQGIVGPGLAARLAIGIAFARIEMRRIEHEKLGTGRGAGQEARGPAEELGIGMDLLRPVQRRQDRGIARHQRAHAYALRRQCAGQGGDDVAEPARLDQGIDLGSDRQNVELAHRASLSIMGWVIRQIPCSVRRNLWLSSSTSSPTTRPAGIRTPRSTTTLVNRTDRPTSTSGRITAWSSIEYELTCKPVKSSVRFRLEPE